MITKGFLNNKNTTDVTKSNSAVTSKNKDDVSGGEGKSTKLKKMETWVDWLLPKVIL